MNKKYLFVILSIIIFLITGCSTKEKSFKIGFIGALSGNRSQLGVVARNAVLLAFENEKELLGAAVSVIVKDNSNDPDLCRDRMHEFMEENVSIIIGPLLSSMAIPVLEVVESKPMLVISPTVSMDAIKDIDDNFLRILQVASSQAEIVADHAAKKMLKKFAVIYDSSNNEYTEPIFLMFKKRIESEGGQVLYVNSLKNKRDYQKIAKEIKQSEAQGLFIITSGTDAAGICQQIAKIAYPIKLYGSTWVKTGNIIEQGGKSVEGLILPNPVERKIKTLAYKEFFAQYYKKYKEEPTFVAVLAYDTARILIEIIKKRKTLDPLAIKKAIIETETFDGLEEKIKINAYGDAERNYDLAVIKNGKFQLLNEK